MLTAEKFLLKNNLLRPDFKEQVKNTLLLKQMITTFSALKTKQMNHGSQFAQIKLNDIRLKIRRMKSFRCNVGLNYQIRYTIQPDNKERTRLVGLHVR